MLAQVQKKLDLTNPASADAKLDVAAADIKSDTCLDMSSDQLNGRSTVVVAGTAEPVCDLDGSGGTGGANCTNLGEVCNGGDPLNAKVDP